MTPRWDGGDGKVNTDMPGIMDEASARSNARPAEAGGGAAAFGAGGGGGPEVVAVVAGSGPSRESSVSSDAEGEGDGDGDAEGEQTRGDDKADDASGGTPRRGKKRKATQQYQKTSCELCKARKVKCDRAEPACGWCASHNRTCVYLERQKPGSRTGFNVELEAKVNKIDALLQVLGRRIEDHIANDHPLSQAAAAAAAGAGGPSTQAVTPGTATYRESPQVNHGTLASSEYGGGPGPSSLGRGTPMDSTRTVMTPATDSFARPDGISDRQGDVPMTTTLPFSPINQSTPRSLSTTPDLPPQDMIYTLVDLYFKHCNTWCPILERQTTFGTFFGSTSLNEADRVLLHAIIATTLRFFKDARLTPAMRAHHHATSRRIVQMYVMDHVSIAALRAGVIITLDELGRSNGPKGWNMLSVLAQGVRQLGLCDESSVYLTAEGDDVPRTGGVRRVAAGRPDSWIEDEGRRRLAWMIYLLDRYSTVATTTFEFMLQDQRMKRFLPCSYDLFSRNSPRETRPPSRVLADDPSSAYNNNGNSSNGVPQTPSSVSANDNLGSFSYHCEILRILSEVHNFLKQPVDVTSPPAMATWRNTYQLLDAALDRWLQSLPSEYSRISALCHSDPASRVANWFMLHSAYVTAVIRLHSPAAYPTVRTEIFVPSHYAMQRCLSAVQSLRDISQDVYEANGLDLLGPPFAFSLWVAARALIVHAAAADASGGQQGVPGGGAVDEKLEFFIETLGYVGQYWEVANNYARILRRVVRRVQQGEMTFAAMRRNAHDLVTLTSSARRTGLDPTSSQATSLSELDSIDVFDFFHYPKLMDDAGMHSRNAYGQTNLLHQQQQQQQHPQMDNGGRQSARPEQESDWMRMGSGYG